MPHYSLCSLSKNLSVGLFFFLFLDLAQPTSPVSLKTKVEVCISYRGENGMSKKVASTCKNVSTNADYDIHSIYFPTHTL